MFVAQTPAALILTRVSFLLTGAWWFGFSQYTFKHLPNLVKLKTNYQKI
jgi:UMF1 family MFS transporter